MKLKFDIHYTLILNNTEKENYFV